MDLQSLGNLGEFLGGIVVVISLFYLAYQVRQNTRSIQAESYARALERVANVQSLLASDPSLASIFNRGTLDPSQLTLEERIRFSWVFYEMFGSFEFIYVQSEKGVLEEDVWARWDATLAWWLSMPGVVQWWEVKPAPFNESFSIHVDALIASNPRDPGAERAFFEWLTRDSS